ncbi:MAG: hypothetical protein NC099_06445, partial [Corallococcus sp.]|nr:hypothetical protein [Corallococcus sp.]
DGVDRLVVDKNGLVTFYTIGSPFTPTGMKVYLANKSTYEENGVWYGAERVQLNRNQVSFRYNNSVINSGYPFTEADVGNQTIIVLYDYNGTDIEGSYGITVSLAVPSAIIITNKSEIESAKYYVGQTFDVNSVKFEAEYTGYANGAVDVSRFVVSDVTLSDVGTKTITFTIATGETSSITVSVDITVSDKETITAKFVSTNFKYVEGQPVGVKITQENGQELPEGITWVLVDANGNPVSLMSIGTYDVEARFTVDKSKYNDIAPIKARIQIREILAAIDRNQLDMPALKVTYGNADFNYKLNNIIITDTDNVSYRVVGTTYTINGFPEGNITVRNAGTYNIVAEIKATATTDEEAITIVETYTIVVDRVKNEIYSLKMASWIMGQTPASYELNAAFGAEDAVITYYREDGVTLYNDGKTRPSDLGNYVIIATIAQGDNYTETVTERCYFSINLAKIEGTSEEGGSVKDEEGKSKVEITSGVGVNPNYRLVITELNEESTSDVAIKNKIVVSGYGIDLLDGSDNRVTTGQEYTVRIKLTAEQLSQKNLEVYSINSIGQSTPLNGTVTEDGYIEFKVSKFDDETSADRESLRFVVAAKDVAAARRVGLIVGVSVGALIAVGAITALIIVFVKKKKENDE